MKFYTFGDSGAPAIMLLPGTFCNWKSNFGAVIPLLEKGHHVICASYDGFDETEKTEFPTMLEETEKIEEYINSHCGGRIHAVYGCSMGGSFVGLLAARGKIHMDIGILGSSDLDQSSAISARFMTNIMVKFIYPFIHEGQFKQRFLQKRLDKRMQEMPEYAGAFVDMLGGARGYVTRKSCSNQFYSDLVTPLPDNIDVPGTEIHIFYALKMGEKYRARYEKHFAHPVVHEHDLLHEELLACRPEEWAQLVRTIID